MLLTHHLDGSLRRIKIKLVILLSSLASFCVFLIVELTIRLVILGAGIEILPSIISLGHSWSRRILLVE